MKRITLKHLEGLVDRLNQITGNPLDTWVKTATGYTAQIGNYHVSQAYGGVSLSQIDTEGGGVRDVLYTGYCSKRELYTAMSAYLRGIELVKIEQGLSEHLNAQSN
jgi:hypothetical protein